MPEPRAETTTLPDRVSTPLLTLITQQSLDEDYQHVAERRAADLDSVRPTPRRRAHLVAGLVVGAFGLLVAVAALQTSESSGVDSAGRATLISQIEERRDDVSEQQRRIVTLQEQTVALQDRIDQLTSAGQVASARIQRVGAVAGFVAVAGPGVRVTVDDAPGGELVRDRDLRPLVNGLWEAGAEAIAVNGQRLTAGSAIRNSGNAIRITGNNRSLSPPYVVTAIGDEDTLQADLMETTSGLTFRDIAESTGFPWSMDNVDQLLLPAAPPRLLRLDTASADSGQKRDSRKEEPQ